jgi:hypothetical protein
MPGIENPSSSPQEQSALAFDAPFLGTTVTISQTNK